MNRIKLFEDYHSNKWMTFIDNIMKSEFLPITDELWDAIESDGYTEEVNDYEGDFDRNNYSYTEAQISDEDKQGLINMDNNFVEKWNDFDIQFKEQGYYPNYLDFIDYDEGKIYIIKHNKI